MSTFKIQEQVLVAEPRPEPGLGFQVKSSPRPYQVTFYSGEGAGQRLANEITSHPTPLLLIDKNIFDLYLFNLPQIDGVPTFLVTAIEENKGIETVLEVIDFLEENKATKSSMLYVVGGGIMQDLGAFAGYIYKRGIPWAYVPTTLLGQGDSSVGGKTALNHKKTKNLLALFSAPRKIITDTGFLKTLPRDDWFSGIGEIFRLCITGGKDFLNVFAGELDAFLAGDKDATNRLIATSLSAKKAIVEFDEFELDLRRSMNYGHSFGHALEALTDYKISHGVGVTIGILVENEIAFHRKLLSKSERDYLISLGSKIIPPEALNIFIAANLDGIIDLLRRDKKAEGTILKLATLESIGQMRFIDFSLDDSGEQELRKAVTSVISSLC